MSACRARLPVLTLRDARTATRHVGAWLGVLGAGALLLHGRYDFTKPLAIRNYASALFLYVLVVPTCYYLLRLTTLRKGVALSLTALVFLVLSLPHHWLHLDRYFRDPHVRWWNELEAGDPPRGFLPKTFPVESFPHERLFFLTLAVSFAAVAIVVRMYALDDRLDPRAALRRVWPWIAAHTTILFVSFLHTGIRSGYTITNYYSDLPEKRNWFIHCLFPNTRQGLVSADFYWFWEIDRYFQGVTQEPRTVLIRRPLVHYFASQFSAFINPYYVYLLINLLLWLAAAACVYTLTTHVTKRRRVALFAAALVCVANGFHYFVAQPMSYVASYAIIAFGFCAFEIVIGPTTHAREGEPSWPWARALLAGAVVGLLGCTYDAQPLLVGLFGFAIFRRFAIERVLLSLGIGAIIPPLFTFLQFKVLHLRAEDTSSGLVDATIKNSIGALEEHRASALYYLLVRVFTVLGQNLAFGFMICSLVLAAVGLVVAPRTRDRWLVVVLAIPALALTVIFVLSQVVWSAPHALADFVRLTYIAYPAVYVSAGLGLERIYGTGSWWRASVVWGLLVAVALWQSIDAFGFVSPIVHFYFPDKYPWLDGLGS